MSPRFIVDVLIILYGFLTINFDASDEGQAARNVRNGFSQFEKCGILVIISSNIIMRLRKVLINYLQLF